MYTNSSKVASFMRMCTVHIMGRLESGGLGKGIELASALFWVWCCT